jgi:hypothetical protein
MMKKYKNQTLKNVLAVHIYICINVTMLTETFNFFDSPIILL